MTKNLKLAAFSAILLMLAGSFSACGEKEISQQPDDDGDWTFIKVADASKYSNITEVRLVAVADLPEGGIELARFEWKDGGFTVELPDFVNPDYLKVYQNIIGLSVSNENVKYIAPFFVGFDKDGNYVTEFFLAKITKDGYTHATYIYVDSDAVLSGYAEYAAYLFEKDKNGNCIYSLENRHLWKTNTTFSMEWKKGWNIQYDSKSISKTKRTITELLSASTTPVCELKFYDGVEYSTAIRNLQNTCPDVDIHF